MKWILTFLSGWQTRVIAVLTVAIAVLLPILKYKSHRLNEVEHEIKMRDKKTNMEDDQNEFKAKVIANEQDEILKKAESNAKKNRNERANDL